MLPPEMELQDPKAKDWPLIPADVYHTEITNIEYKEIDNRWKKEPTDPDKKQIMNFEFTIIEEGPYYGRKMWKQMAPIKPYPPQQSGKESWVYRLASAMAGHAITRGEADKYGTSDINDFYHRQVRITVSETAPKDNGKRYNNLDSFLSTKQQLPPFDVNKVPKENQPEPKPDATPTAATASTGYDKFKEAHDNIGAPKSQAAVNSEPPVAPDIAQSAAQMAGEDINVEDIPF
jgi:hypothetical protein